VELSPEQLEALFALIAVGHEARQTFNLGIAAHHAELVEEGIGGDDFAWASDIGSFDQLWINGHHSAAFADQAARQKALDEAKQIFELVTGLIPAPSFGKGLAAQIAGNAYGEITGLIGDGVKGTFGSVPSDIDVALDNRVLTDRVHDGATAAQGQSYLDAGLVEVPSDLT
jgi:hypothetical protein